MVPYDKIVFPPLHIKLGFMQKFVKALDKEGDCFQYICKRCSSLSNKRLKVGIFDASEIKQSMRDQITYDTMNEM